MRLADFISANLEPILAEWVAFAGSCGPAGRAMDLTALRDHAQQMLEVIAADLRTPQTAREQSEKSKGQADSDEASADTAAQVHGSDRAQSGFSVDEMVSEYRALRATVIRLWTEQCGALTGDDLQDLMRFNEAIDQALAESIARYTADLDRSKEVFLAMLGHDLRSPLGAVIMASQFMLDTAELQEPHLTLTTRITRSAKRMNRMVGDLLDYTRGQLGSGLPIVRADMDLGKEVRHAVEEISAANPDGQIELDASGDLHGAWDCARIGQVLSNLLGNSLQHGLAKSTVYVTVRGEEGGVSVKIHNRGPAIDPGDIPGLFSPFKRLGTDTLPPGASSSLGLGLYIVDRIVSAHGGSIEVSSSEAAGTTFTVFLPR